MPGWINYCHSAVLDHSDFIGAQGLLWLLIGLLNTPLIDAGSVSQELFGL